MALLKTNKSVIFIDIETIALSAINRYKVHAIVISTEIEPSKTGL